MEPTFATGKLCYLEIPAEQPDISAAFYRDAFGWETRERGDGSLAFDDAVGEVSGTWVTGRAPMRDAGIVAYVMVADIEVGLHRVRAAGGDVVRDVDADARERFAHVRDPAGNLIGVYEQAGLAAREAAIPRHLRTVTPRLVVSPAIDALAFYARAFAARDIGERYCMPDGTLAHAEVEIGNSVVMVSEGEGFKALLATHWVDVDQAWERALSAGAQVVYPLADQFYGERAGRIEDPFGQQWMLAARIEELSAAEVDERMKALAD